MYFVGKYGAGNICLVRKYSARASLEPDRAGTGGLVCQRTGPLNGSGSLHRARRARRGTWVAPAAVVRAAPPRRGRGQRRGARLVRSGASGMLGQGRYGEPRVSEGCFEVSNGVRDSEELISRAAQHSARGNMQ